MNVDVLIAELRQEGATTRTVLERVPEDRLSWSPHQKSRTLGQLAYHVAGVPKGITAMLDQDEAPPPDVPPTEASSREELLRLHDESMEVAAAALQRWGEDGLRGRWRMMVDGNAVIDLPRIAMVRMLMMNHLYHHRGQLSVYLRLLDIPLPPIYGPTADESPFG